MIKPQVIWLTGLSGSGKTSLASLLDKALKAKGLSTFLIDGDLLRKQHKGDLGFSRGDRSANVRRAIQLATEKIKENYIVIASLTSPYLQDRALARSVIGVSQFREVYVNTPLSVCEARDPKGLYQKARLGLISNMVGIDLPYEISPQPDFTIDTSKASNEVWIDRLLAQL
jgi:adenylyl-sulfate kinase